MSNIGQPNQRPRLSSFIRRFSLVELSGDTFSAIRQLVGRLADGRAVPAADALEILDGVLKREQLGTPHLGSGLAVPHLRSGVVPATVAVLGRSADGLDWPGPNPGPVHVAVLILSPPERSG